MAEPFYKRIEDSDLENLDHFEALQKVQEERDRIDELIEEALTKGLPDLVGPYRSEQELLTNRETALFTLIAEEDKFDAVGASAHRKTKEVDYERSLAQEAIEAYEASDAKKQAMAAVDAARKNLNDAITASSKAAQEMPTDQANYNTLQQAGSDRDKRLAAMQGIKETMKEKRQNLTQALTNQRVAEKQLDDALTYLEVQDSQAYADAWAKAAEAAKKGS
jgi:hypothetical protein